MNIIGRYAVIKHCPCDDCAPPLGIIERLNDLRLGASIQEAHTKTAAADDDKEEADEEKKHKDNIIFCAGITCLFAIGVITNISDSKKV